MISPAFCLSLSDDVVTISGPYLAVAAGTTSFSASVSAIVHEYERHISSLLPLWLEVLVAYALAVVNSTVKNVGCVCVLGVRFLGSRPQRQIAASWAAFCFKGACMPLSIVAAVKCIPHRSLECFPVSWPSAGIVCTFSTSCY